jgi:hypothetical protein
VWSWDPPKGRKVRRKAGLNPYSDTSLLILEENFNKNYLRDERLYGCTILNNHSFRKSTPKVTVSVSSNTDFNS